MDDVPYLTQFPVAQNETFRYEFTPPDVRTYWYQPKCLHNYPQVVLFLIALFDASNAFRLLDLDERHV